MNVHRRLRLAVVGFASLAIVAGCGLGGGNETGTPSTSGVPSASPPTPTALPAPTSPAPGSGSPAACTLPVPGKLMSDTLMDAVLEKGAAADRLVFTFGTRPPEAIAEPTIGIVFADPPFAMAGSGEPVTVAGDRHLKVRMDGMVVARPDGAPVYTGERNLALPGGTIPQAVMTDEFEGVVTWIVGLGSGGCPTIQSETIGGDRLVIELAH